MRTEISGFCPYGCGQTLQLDDHAEIGCSFPGCPYPYALTDMLLTSETEHLVFFDSVGFTIKHPLRERLNDELLDCRLHHFCHDLEGPPEGSGRYRVSMRHGTWQMDKINEP